MKETADRSWWSRNWGCVLGCGCLGCLIAVAGIVGAILFGLNSIANAGPLGEAVEIAAAHPDVRAELGEPVKSAWGFNGSVHLENDSGHADYSLPLRGPDGRGRLYVVATKTRGRWTFEVLEVEVRGRSQRIDLLDRPEDPGDPGDPADPANPGRPVDPEDGAPGPEGPQERRASRLPARPQDCRPGPARRSRPDRLQGCTRAA